MCVYVLIDFDWLVVLIDRVFGDIDEVNVLKLKCD